MTTTNKHLVSLQTCECGAVLIDLSGNSKQYPETLIELFNLQYPIQPAELTDICPHCNSEDCLHENIRPEYGGMARKIYNHLVNSTMQATKVRIKKSLYRLQQLGKLPADIAELDINAFSAALFPLAETLMKVNERFNEAIIDDRGISKTGITTLSETIEKHL